MRVRQEQEELNIGLSA